MYCTVYLLQCGKGIETKHNFQSSGREAYMYQLAINKVGELKYLEMGLL